MIGEDEACGCPKFWGCDDGVEEVLRIEGIVWEFKEQKLLKRRSDTSLPSIRPF
jgi:hypothetical protein